MKKAPFKSRKNFSATDAGMLDVCTQSSASAYLPHRKVPVKTSRRLMPDKLYYPISKKRTPERDSGLPGSSAEIPFCSASRAGEIPYRFPTPNSVSPGAG